jgi:tRNA(Ile)-lysidine synthase
MSDPGLHNAIASVPSGPWAVGVSGGADSIALLSLLRHRTDLSLHVAHLDHETRGEASTGDATFVRKLAADWNLACTCARRREIEPLLARPLPANPSALYRALRLAFFKRTVDAFSLHGVILAHHADDQAETVLQRLLRTWNYAGLAAMLPRAVVGGLVILRPVLGVRRAQLREYLRAQGLAWREDASNESEMYLRNRLRRLLAASPQLGDALLGLSDACATLRDWARASAPELGQRFAPVDLARQPRILAHESARWWLIERGVPVDQIEPTTIETLLTMALDAASPARHDLPGGVRICRRRGEIFADVNRPQTRRA